MGDWVIRSYEPDDEACCASMWLKGYAHSDDVREAGYADAAVDASPDEVAYWRTYQPIVTGLLRSADVRVACDPERVHAEPGRPAVIWAWAAMSDDQVHWVGVKRQATKAGLGEDLVRDLLGDRLERPMRTTFDLVDLWKLRLIPKNWQRDRRWLEALRVLSMRMQTRDPVFAAVGGYVMDLRRQQWEVAA